MLSTSILQRAIQLLAPTVTSARFNAINHAVKHRVNNITFIFEHLINPSNIAACLRLFALSLQNDIFLRWEFFSFI
jgi:hypothetical protein